MIKQIIEKYLPIVSSEETLADLGDRGDYIGASDVTGCPRKVVLNKLISKKHDTKQIIVFQRGHIGEQIVKKPAIKAKDQKEISKLIYQYEVSIMGGSIKAHPDFIIQKNDGSFVVVECKTSDVVEQPRESWVLQNIFQMGLLLRKNPDYEGKISGEVIALDLKTGNYEEYDVKFNPEIFDGLIKKAQYLLDCVNNPEIDPDTIETEVSALCGYCDHRQDCPAYLASKNELPDDLKIIIKEYSELDGISKDIEKRKNSLKETITSFGDFKTVFDGIKAQVSTAVRTSIDTYALKSNYPEIAEAYKKETAYAKFLCSSI